MIEFKGVTKRFGEKLVLDHVDFRLGSGEIVFVIGKSGMGKSVLLKHIVGLIRPDEGEIWVAGQEVSRLKERDYLAIRRMCGMVFQFPALLDALTVYENVAFGIRAHEPALHEEEIRERVRVNLSQVGLPMSIGNRYPLELSFSRQKRVSIARALAVGPQYLLFDEPTTGLDPVVTSTINQLILGLSKKLRVTSLVVSHDMHCALEIADRILLLDRGKIVASGNPEELIYHPHPLAVEFLKEAKGKLHAH